MATEPTLGDRLNRLSRELLDQGRDDAAAMLFEFITAISTAYPDGSEVLAEFEDRFGGELPRDRDGVEEVRAWLRSR